MTRRDLPLNYVRGGRVSLNRSAVVGQSRPVVWGLWGRESRRERIFLSDSRRWRDCPILQNRRLPKSVLCAEDSSEMFSTKRENQSKVKIINLKNIQTYHRMENN